MTYPANSRDWTSTNDGDLQVSAGGELLTCSFVEALTRALAHELEQPLKSLPWDEAEELIEAGYEGSRLFAEIDADAAGSRRRLERELARVTRQPRFKDWIDRAEIADLTLDGDGLNLTVRITAGGETALAVARIGI